MPTWDLPVGPDGVTVPSKRANCGEQAGLSKRIRLGGDRNLCTRGDTFADDFFQRTGRPLTGLAHWDSSSTASKCSSQEWGSNEQLLSSCWDIPKCSTVTKRQRPSHSACVAVDSKGLLQLRADARGAVTDRSGERRAPFALVSLHPLSGAGETIPARRWQLDVRGTILCMCLSGEFAAIAVEDCIARVCELFIVGVACGRLLLPPLRRKAPTVDIRIEGRTLLILDDVGGSGLSLFHFVPPSSLQHRLTADLPPWSSHLAEMGVLPQPRARSESNATPFLRFADGRTVAYDARLCAWLAADTWRYTSSPLQNRGPLSCPRNGALFRQLWQWRSLGKLPPTWHGAHLSASDAPGGNLVQGVGCSRAAREHIERRSHLCHDLSVLSALGTPTEVAEALADVVSYCKDVGDDILLAELAAMVEKEEAKSKTSTEGVEGTTKP